MNKINLDKIKIIEISPEDTLDLRHRVLWPDKPIGYCIINGDNSALHLGAFYEEKLTCIASIFKEPRAARLRKFATEPEYQSFGVGTKMIETIINKLTQEDVTDFWCDARESATNFYSKFGMKRIGGSFYKGEIPYFKMSMQLTKINN